jgi:hypothetical protein
MVQLGNVCANFIYRTDDSPLYRRGNRDLVIINILVIGVFIFTKIYYVLRNKSRDKKWNAMTEEVCSTLTTCIIMVVIAS